MAELALLTHVYNAQAAVEGHIANWQLLDQADLERLEIRVVDDCSDVPLSVNRAALPLRTFRITTDIPWNMAGAKNLLRMQSSAPWLLFFDVDNMLPAPDLHRLIVSLPSLQAQTIYMFARTHDGVAVDSHINTFLIHRDVLNAVGGFDEDFCGHYGFEDVYFHHLAVRKGFNRVLLVDLTFLQGNARTETLDRDLSRNDALAQGKASRNEDTAPRQLRFEWIET